MLVESRPEQLAKDNWADGPIEMLFASLTARSLGIEVDGVDWHEDDPSKFGTTWKERDDRRFSAWVCLVDIEITTISRNPIGKEHFFIDTQTKSSYIWKSAISLF